MHWGVRARDRERAGDIRARERERCSGRASERSKEIERERDREREKDLPDFACQIPHRNAPQELTPTSLFAPPFLAHAPPDPHSTPPEATEGVGQEGLQEGDLSFFFPSKN